jgi:hypothetical protein
MALHARLSATDFADWRYDLLVRAGFASALARTLTQDPRIDIHRLLELTDRGCPPHLAARILAPLDEPGDYP